jgi:hypothetical protein
MAEESTTRTTRLSGELDRRYEEYRDKYDMTDAEALRSLLRGGLDEHESDDKPQRSATDELLLSTASNLATITVVIALLGAAELVAPAAAALVGTVSLVVAAIFVAEVSRRPVRRLAAAVRQLDVDESAPPEVSD